MVYSERRTRSTPTATKNNTHTHTTHATATRPLASDSKVATRMAIMKIYERTYGRILNASLKWYFSLVIYSFFCRFFISHQDKLKKPKI